MLFLKPTSGLCNRLRAIHSAIGLCSEIQRPLVVFWDRDTAMNASYLSLFKKPNCFALYDGGVWTSLSKVCFSSYTPFRLVRRDPDGEFKLMQSDIRSGCRFVPRVCIAWEEFYRNSNDWGWLRPTDDIQQEVDGIYRMIGPDLIGLHIRRTDNEMSIKESPLSYFELVIAALIKQKQGQKFFLASDDEQVKAKLTKRFGDSIYCRKDIARREDCNGVRDAVVDLLLLSRCKRLYGSYWSSFSNVAADIGGLPRINLSSKNIGEVLNDLNSRRCDE